jgi:hypothetical protein
MRCIGPGKVRQGAVGEFAIAGITLVMVLTAAPLLGL